MPVKQIKNWTVFGEVQTSTIYDIYRMFIACSLNLTSIQKST